MFRAISALVCEVRDEYQIWWLPRILPSLLVKWKWPLVYHERYHEVLPLHFITAFRPDFTIDGQHRTALGLWTVQRANPSCPGRPDPPFVCRTNVNCSQYVTSWGMPTNVDGIRRGYVIYEALSEIQSAPRGRMMSIMLWTRSVIAMDRTRRNYCTLHVPAQTPVRIENRLTDANMVM